MIGAEMGEAFILRKEIEDLKAEIEDLKNGMPK
jgi:cell division protein FtsB